MAIAINTNPPKKVPPSGQKSENDSFGIIDQKILAPAQTVPSMKTRIKGLDSDGNLPKRARWTTRDDTTTTANKGAIAFGIKIAKGTYRSTPKPKKCPLCSCFKVIKLNKAPHQFRRATRITFFPIGGGISDSAARVIGIPTRSYKRA